MAADTDNVPLWINGKEELSASIFSVIDPNTNTKCWTASSAKIEQAILAIEVAQATFPSWSATKLAERQKILSKVADLMEERMEHCKSSLTHA